MIQAFPSAHDDFKEHLLWLLEKHLFTPVRRASPHKYSFANKLILEFLKAYMERERMQLYEKNAAAILQYLDTMTHSEKGQYLNTMLSRLRLPTFASIGAYIVFLGKYAEFTELVIHAIRET